ncbi:MAG: hypothetical protein K2X87_10940 [Gemmataceae bacterium]|nr:hypothetical protein [Gemmataceae bacterium]
MTPDQQTPDPAQTPEPASAPPAAGWWGPDPPPLTAEEIADIEANGLDLSEVVASILAEYGEPYP